MPGALESELYAPVKAYLESLGFDVKAEVGRCDVAAMKDGLVVAVELKLQFSLQLVYQALDRSAAADATYVAVAVPAGRKARANWDKSMRQAEKLCRMLGIGLLAVSGSVVEIIAETAPYVPRKSPKRRVRLVREFSRRSGDHNVGGTTRRLRVTGFREECLAIARELANCSPQSPAHVRNATGVADASAKLSRNHYGWFERVGRGQYAITPAGLSNVELFSAVLESRDQRLGVPIRA